MTIYMVINLERLIMKLKPLRIIKLLLLAMLLAACGGGEGGGGGGGAAPVAARYAYVVNAGDNSVSTYAVDAATGRLKYIGKAATGSSPASVTVDPSGRYAYVANQGGDSVSQYTIGATGALAPMATATVAAGSSPRSVTTTGEYQ